MLFAIDLHLGSAQKVIIFGVKDGRRSAPPIFTFYRDCFGIKTSYRIQNHYRIRSIDVPLDPQSSLPRTAMIGIKDNTVIFNVCLTYRFPFLNES